MVDLTTGVETFSYTGSSVSRTATGDGMVRAKLWGGAGAGFLSSGGTGSIGGSGGYTYVEFKVLAGDVITIETARGGQAPSSGSGGLGGWPDGGDGGVWQAGGVRVAGGGGGSSRVYVNGTLVAVAGGGGGAGATQGQSVVGGAGGGTTGRAGLSTSPGGGGTQSAGGGQPGQSDSARQGGFLTGGKGYPAAGSITTANTDNGAGGGGGYYGGGGGYNALNDGAGGGGSGYLHASLALFGQTLQGALLGVAPAIADPDYPGGTIAKGGTSAGAGGNGHTWVEFSPWGTPTAWNGAALPISYSGARQNFVAQNTGDMTIKAWGGAGAGSYSAASNTNVAGGGGYIYGVISVTAGDVISIEVAQGGRKGTSTSGGLGGWPDGGKGGRGGSPYGMGGGGGATYIYINGKLVAIAAGGGAAGAFTGNSGGPGGGTTGGNGTGTNNGTGATATAPGVSVARPTYNQPMGWIRKGGWGLPDGLTSITTSDIGVGGGGGGGLWGGGGAAPVNSQTYPPGGGGSSFLHASLTSSSTTAATAQTPYDDGAVYPGGGIAVGGASTVSAPTDGGNGHVYLIQDVTVPADIDIDTFVTIGVSTVTGLAQVAATVSGDVGSVTMSAPTVQAGVDGTAEGVLGTINVFPPEVLPITAATINVAINENQEIITVPPEAEAVGEGAYFAVDYLPTVTIHPLQGEVSLIEPGSVDIDVLPFEHQIVITPVLAAVDGDKTVEPFFLPPIDVTPPQAQPHVAGAAEVGEFEHAVVITAMEAESEDGSSAPADFGDPVTIPAIPEAAATGEAVAYTEDVGGFWLHKIDMVAPQVTVAFGQTITINEIATVETSPAQGTASFSVEIAADLGRRVLVTAPRVLAYEGDGAVALGDLPSILVTAPEAWAGTIPVAADAYATFPTVYVSPPAGIARFGPIEAEVEAAIPVIQVSAPECYVEVDTPDFAPLRFARSNVHGASPDSLVEREIRINEADGVLFSRDDAGEVAATPYLALHEGGYAPEGGVEGQVLAANGTWVDPELTYDLPLRATPAAATRIVLCDTPMGTGSAELTLDRVYYRPFYVTRAFSATELAVEVEEAASSTIWLGLCRWSAEGEPGEVVFSGSVSGNSEGLQSVVGDFTVPIGWCAAMIAVTGAETPVLRATKAPLVLDEDFSLVGDPTAPFVSNLTTAPDPDSMDEAAHAFVLAETA